MWSNDAMDAVGPSLARRALALVVLAVVAVLAFRFLLGVISTVFWIVALVALLIAGLWAMSTLRSAHRARAVKKSSSATLAAPAHEDRMEAELLKLKQQLRDQGPL